MLRMPWSCGDAVGGPYLVYGSHYYQVRYTTAGWGVFFSPGCDEYLEPVLLEAGFSDSEKAKAYAERHLGLAGR